MPYVTYELQSIDEAMRVGPIGPDLQAVADECNVNPNIVRGKNEPVIVEGQGMIIPPAAMDKLRGLAEKGAVTIYVYPAT